MRMPRKGWWVLVVLSLLAIAGLLFWSLEQHQPMPEALAALASDAEIGVETGRWLLLRPLGPAPRTGLILYPGGVVDPRAYSPPARAIAAEGYLVAIVPMPLNLAILGSNRAADVRSAFPEIEHWALGRHSLGGAMAARYAYRFPSTVEGLVLWAAYPAAGDDLSARELAVASIYGTLDGVATPPEIDASRPLLPPDTQWKGIEGGNHAQFGRYGLQSGDRPATLSRTAQQAQIVRATIDLLRTMGE
jgi:hypothetical protein